MGCLFPIVVGSMLPMSHGPCWTRTKWPSGRPTHSKIPHAKFGRNDHGEDASHFISFILLKETDCTYPNLDVDIGTYLSGAGKWKNYHCQFYLSQVEPFQKRRIRNSAKIYECLRANKANQLLFIKTDNWQEKQQKFLQFSQIMWPGGRKEIISIDWLHIRLVDAWKYKKK